MMRRLFTVPVACSLFFGALHCSDSTPSGASPPGGSFLPDSSTSRDSAPPDSSTAAPGIDLIGHDALFNRGMNAAPALFGDFMYIGNRTDGSSHCGVGDPRLPPSSDGATDGAAIDGAATDAAATDAAATDGAIEAASTEICPHPHPGVLVVDIKDPAHPAVVGEIGPPDEGNVGVTSRELRAWPSKNLLIVMNFRCSSVIHSCPPGTDVMFPFDFKFFDLADPVHPRLLSSYVPTSAAGRAVKPHEMFLWIDPKNPDRALMFITTPTVSVDPALPNLVIADISAVPGGGAVTEVAEGNWNNRFMGAEVPANYDTNLILHSIGVSVDGSRTYMALEAGHFLVLDTSSVVANVPADGAPADGAPAADAAPADGAASAADAAPADGAPEVDSAAADGATSNALSLNDKLLTEPANRPIWGPPAPCTSACPNSHSAVKVPGRQLIVATDEVYGKFTLPAFGCPWGWMRLISIADEAHPTITGEYKIPQNEQSFCGTAADDPQTEQFASFTSHNPTVTANLAIVTWHSGGLQIVDISNPADPKQAASYSPTPLPMVANEDPALGGGTGPNKVIVWSYPIIKNGLIYIIDIRNGLYILRYHGAHEDEVTNIKFLEGNSTLGDARN